MLYACHDNIPPSVNYILTLGGNQEYNSKKGMYYEDLWLLVVSNLVTVIGNLGYQQLAITDERCEKFL